MDLYEAWEEEQPKAENLEITLLSKKSILHITLYLANHSLIELLKQFKNGSE